MLQRALCTHRQSEKPQDAEWVHMVLSFLKSYVENMGEETLIQGFEKVEYVSTLVESLKQSIETLDNGELVGLTLTPKLTQSEKTSYNLIIPYYRSKYQRMRG